MSEQTHVELAREFIASTVPFTPNSEDEPDGGVLVGFLIIAEWATTDGYRWLSKISGSASGDKQLPGWTTRGYCAEVLHNWQEDAA